MTRNMKACRSKPQIQKKYFSQKESSFLKHWDVKELYGWKK